MKMELVLNCTAKTTFNIPEGMTKEETVKFCMDNMTSINPAYLNISPESYHLENYTFLEGENVNRAEEAMRKLCNEAENKDNGWSVATKSYYEAVCLAFNVEELFINDSVLAENFLQENKTFKKFYEFCFSKAKKEANNSNGYGLKDDELLDWLREYCALDETKVNDEQKKENVKKSERKSSKTATPTTEVKAQTVPSVTESASVNHVVPKGKRDIPDQLSIFDMFE